MTVKQDMTAYLNGVEDTQQGAFRCTKVVLPILNILQTVHHTSIVTVGHRSDQGEELQAASAYCNLETKTGDTHNDGGQLCKEPAVESGIPPLHELSQIGCHHSGVDDVVCHVECVSS